MPPSCRGAFAYTLTDDQCLECGLMRQRGFAVLGAFLHAGGFFALMGLYLFTDVFKGVAPSGWSGVPLARYAGSIVFLFCAVAWLAAAGFGMLYAARRRACAFAFSGTPLPAGETVLAWDQTGLEVSAGEETRGCSWEEVRVDQRQKALLITFADGRNTALFHETTPREVREDLLRCSRSG